MSGRALVIASRTCGSASDALWLSAESHTSVIHSALPSRGSLATT